jgi:hypothetical protein
MKVLINVMRKVTPIKLKNTGYGDPKYEVDY